MPSKGLSCFGFVFTPMAFQEAATYCMKLGTQRGMFGSLIEPRDDYDTKFLIRSFAEMQWRGPDSESPTMSASPWVGIYRNVEVDDAHFYFLKYHEEVGFYAPWKTAFDRVVGSAGVVLDTSTGKWIMQSLTKASPFICKFENESPPSPFEAACEAVVSEENAICGCGLNEMPPINFSRSLLFSERRKTSFVRVASEYANCAVSFGTETEKFTRGLRRAYDCGGPMGRISFAIQYYQVERKLLVARLINSLLLASTSPLTDEQTADLNAFSKTLETKTTLRSLICVLLCSPGEMLYDDNECRSAWLGLREFVEYARSLVGCEISAKLETQTSNDALYQRGTHLLLAINNLALASFASSVDLCSSVMQDIGMVASWIVEEARSEDSLSLIYCWVLGESIQFAK